ncbi:thiamine phosphate synthase [bacterium]|nr:thiamine phosphate synthase [bacterium]NIN92028.1 thiamine phosphate synthase [bacterium]NIO18244.1 thiamine phosphate synthase [bacterium]NIO73218.1 thiamine phosphate synthase [bacterium]
MIKTLQDVELYVILSPRPDMDYLKMAEESLLGGADMVQLRVKDWTDKKTMEIGEKLREVTADYNVPMVVNDRLDIALALGADGVHIGQQDMPLALVRKLLMWEAAGASIYKSQKQKLQKGSPLPQRRSITRFTGVSTHSLKEAVKAEKEGADYISIGPVFPTPSKPELKQIGLNPVRQLRKKLKIPFFAIGGIDQENIEEVIHAGAERVAVIHVVFGAKNVRKAAREIKRRIKQAKG